MYKKSKIISTFLFIFFSIVVILLPRDFDLGKYYYILDNQELDKETSLNSLVLNAQDLAYCRYSSKKITEEECFLLYYKEYAYNNGPDKAFRHLSSMIKIQPEILTGCHYIAHGIGEGSYLRNNKDLNKSYAFDVAKHFSNVGSCGNGYYHGITIGLIRGIEDEESLVVHLRNFCKLENMWGGIGERSCMHGIGHAVTIYFNHDRSKSVSMCKKLFEDNNERIGSCLGGVMMEYGLKLVELGIDYPYVSGLKELCKEYDTGTMERIACIVEGAGVVRRDTDFKGAVTACKTLDNREDIMACTKLQLIHAVRIFRTDEFKKICGYLDSLQDRIECTALGALYLATSVELRDRKIKDKVISDVCHLLPLYGYFKCVSLVKTNKNILTNIKPYGIYPTFDEWLTFFKYF